MKKLAMGLIAGSVLGGGLGMSYFLKDRKNRERIMKDGRKIAKRGRVAINDLSDLF